MRFRVKPNVSGAGSLIGTVMCKAKRKLLLVLVSTLVALLLLGLSYAHRRSKFAGRVNAAFDPQRKAFRGVYLPWPVGRPTLAGALDPETYGRIGTALGYERGSISTNGMTLTIYASDGHFIVNAN